MEKIIPDIDERRKICLKNINNCDKCPLSFIWCFPDDYEQKSNIKKEYIQLSLFEEVIK